MAKFYKYVGDGMGVAGLPHEVSDDEAAELGVSEILKEAIANGSYAPLSPKVTSPQISAGAEYLEGGKQKIKKGDK